jgi:hypothetical protein
MLLLAILVLLLWLVAGAFGPADVPGQAEALEAEPAQLETSLDNLEDRIAAARGALRDLDASPAARRCDEPAGLCNGDRRAPWGNYVPRDPRERAQEDLSGYMWAW